MIPHPPPEWNSSKYYDYGYPVFLGIAEGPACNIRNHFSTLQEEGDIQTGELIFATGNIGYLLNIPPSCDIAVKKCQSAWLTNLSIQGIAYSLSIN